MINLADIWRAAAAAADWRTGIRRWTHSPIVDVAFISNMRDSVDRKRFLGSWHPPEGHFNANRFRIHGVSGMLRCLDIVTEDLVEAAGREKARTHFISAVEWAEKSGVRVVLLAASTKRLFGEDGSELKRRFPHVLFTIGDNGTILLLREETLRALNGSRLQPGSARIGILGPYGLLGGIMTKAMVDRGFDVIGAGPNEEGLSEIRGKFGIPVCRTFAEMGKVDAVVACTHSEKIRLSADNVDLVRQPGKKLLVIDVAEPSNLRRREYEKCKDRVIRQDAGNAYAPSLKYVLGVFSYRLLRLTRGVTFGCFAEALSLACALNRGEDIRKYDWLKVNESNMSVVAELFRKDGFAIPSPRCFGKKVRSFCVELNNEQSEHQKHWR